MSRRSVFGLVAFAWAAVVVAAYYVAHKPFSLSFLIGLSPLIVLFGTILVGQMLGERLIPQTPSVSEDTGCLSRRGRLALSVGLGLGLLGLIQLGLAAAGILTPIVGWMLIAIAVVWAIVSGRWREWGEVIRWPTDRASHWLAIFCALMLGVALLRSLAPPTAWDALVYHLTGPKLYLQTGRLNYDLDLPYLGFPQWSEMLFLWAMQLGGDRAAAMMHWVFAPLTLMLLPELMRPIANGRAWLAAAILLSTMTAVVLAAWPYAEWMMMFAITAAAVCLTRSYTAETAEKEKGALPTLAGIEPRRREERQVFSGPLRPWRLRGEEFPVRTERAIQRDSAVRFRWLALAGAFAGLAFGAKYSAAGAIVGLVLAVGVSENFRLQNSNSKWQRLAIFSGAAAVTASPWLIKNLVLTGNPVYPFFLAGKFWDAARAAWYSRGGTGLPLTRLLIAPWEMTVSGAEGLNGYSASLGPLWLMLLPLIVWRWRERSAPERTHLKFLLTVAGTAYVVWLAQAGWSALLVQSRLLFAVLPLLACAAAAAFPIFPQAVPATALTPLAERGKGKRKELNERWLIGAIIGVVLILAAVEQAQRILLDNPLPVMTGSESEADYLRGKLGWYALAIEQINALPPDSKVIFLWEPRSYHCAAPVRCEPDALLDRWWHLRQSNLSAASIARLWKAEGVTHVLVFEAGRAAVEAEGFDPLTAADWAELESLRARELNLVTDFGGAYQLYEIKR